MKDFFVRHFGKMSALFCVILYVVTNYLGVDIAYYVQSLGINFILVVVFGIILYVLICYFYREKFMNLYRILFWFVIIGIQAVSFVCFENSLKQDFESETISMVELNTSLTLGRVILLLILFIIFLMMGSFFDYFINKNRRFLKKKKN